MDETEHNTVELCLTHIMQHESRIFHPDIGNAARMMQLHSDYSDEELFNELLRRDRIGRIEVESIAPDYYVQDGLSVEHQIDEAWGKVAREAVRQHCHGKIPAGAKIETISPSAEGLFLGGARSARRVKFTVSYFIDRPKICP